MRVRAANAQDAAPAQPAPLTLPGPPAPAPLPLRDEEMPAEDAIVPADVLDSHADPRFQIARIDPTANNVLCRLVLAKDCRLCSRPPQTHALLNEVSFAAHLALPPRGEDTLVASEAPPMAITEYIRQNEVAGERPQPLHLAVYEAQRKSKTKTAMKESFNEFAVFVAKDRHVISGRVEYDDACDTRCCFVADTHRIRCVSVRCVDILARVVAGLKQSGVDYSRVGLSSKLVLVECKWAASESSAVTIDMYMLRNATGRSGRTKATQTFIGYKDTFNVATLSPHLDVVPEVDGMIVTPMETAYTPQPECPSHFDPHNTGAYMHFTEKHVANAICDRFRHVINKELDYASVTFYDLTHVRSDRVAADADERKVIKKSIIEMIDVRSPTILLPKASHNTNDGPLDLVLWKPSRDLKPLKLHEMFQTIYCHERIILGREFSNACVTGLCRGGPSMFQWFCMLLSKLVMCLLPGLITIIYSLQLRFAFPSLPCRYCHQETKSP